MITTDCPLCAGEAHLDPRLDTLACDGCGVDVGIAPDPVAPLEAAA